MTAQLKVRKEFQESEVHFAAHNNSYKVKLSEASQEQLQLIKEAGVDVFEVENKAKDK